MFSWHHLKQILQKDNEKEAEPTSLSTPESQCKGVKAAAVKYLGGRYRVKGFKSRPMFYMINLIVVV